MFNEKSLKNLRPFNQMTVEERTEIARLGGLASGEQRRRYKRLQKCADAYLYYLRNQDEFESLSRMTSKQLSKAMKTLDRCR